MTTQYTELMGSRKLSRNKDSYSAERTFLVYDDTGSSLSIEDAINYTGGVSFSEQHPDIDGIYANGFSINASATRKDTWQVSWTYAKPEEETDAGGDDDVFDDDGDNTDIDPVDGGDFEPPDGDDSDGGGQDPDTEEGDEGTDDGTDEASDESQEGEVFYTGVSLTTGLALVDGYVAGATIPSGGTETGSEITSGTVVHEGGEPVTVPVPTTDISLTETVFGEYFYLDDVQMKASKRNAGTFYGFNIGSVVFKGMSVQRQDVSKWSVTYNFIWDAWSHMRQVPKRTEEGDPDFNVDGTLDIYFKQPFPNRTSFNFAP